MSEFTAEPLVMAERDVRAKRRKFIDFDQFMSDEGKWDRHILVLGSNGNAYDRCHHISLCDHSHEPYPLHSLARPYLDAISHLQGGEVPTIYDQELLTRQAPLYFAGPSVGTFACVDLTAAYWQLYRVASLDLQYDGQSTPRNGAIKFLGSAELEPHKLLRNAIIGTCRAEFRTESNYGIVSTVATGPRFRRPALWAWIIDTLEAIAWEARMLFGALHVQVDGYVVPADCANDLVKWLLTEWGLVATIRASGEGKITGLGNWEIESTEAGFPEPFAAGQEHIDNMVRRDWTGLREWYCDALEYYSENPEIKLVDGRSVPW